MRMSKSITLSILAALFTSQLRAATYSKQLITPFLKASGGLIARSGSAAPVYGIAGGFASGVDEIVFGYTRAFGLRGDNLLSGDADLHTLGVEYRRLFKVSRHAFASVGGGIGYTVPNLSDGNSETADNGVSWTAGASVVRDFGATALELGVSGFFFRTDSRSTAYSSHGEILSNGQEVSVVDSATTANRAVFDSVLLSLSLRFQ